MNKKLAGIFLSLALMASCRNSDDKPSSNGLSPAQKELFRIGNLAIECGSKVDSLTNLLNIHKKLAKNHELIIKNDELLIKALEDKDSLRSLLVDHQDQLIANLQQQVAKGKPKGETVKSLKNQLNGLIQEKKVSSAREQKWIEYSIKQTAKLDSLENN